MVITTSQLRESPQMVEEKPERAERGPAPMPQVLRRAYSGRGGVGCSVRRWARKTRRT